MKSGKTIFLSYRRDDNPGYVRQLQEDLQRNFGKDSVFRDVEHIAGGASWKQVLEFSLEDSAALIVIIGTRWEQVWNERKDENSDYIVYELNFANDRGIPIIPVTVDGATLSGGTDLGALSWLRDKQFYDISDRQGRWSTDVAGLVALLERLPGITSVNPEKNKKTGSNLKLLLVPLAIVLLVAVAWLYKPEPKVIVASEPQVPASTPETVPAQVTVPATAALTTPQVATSEPGVAATTQQNTESITAAPEVQTETYPDVSGTWVTEDGVSYAVGPVSNGRFSVGNLEFQGSGQFIPRMPGKFTVKINGLGEGEYSLTTDNQRLVGWFVYSGMYEKEYETLYRLE